MAITTEITIATAISGGNVLLLGILAYVWIQNYRTFRTSMILGLLAFSVVLMCENLVAVYFFFADGMLYGSEPHVQRAVMILRGLQFIALLFLSYVTLK